MIEVDPRLLERAAKEGRVRGIALDLWNAAKARPTLAGGVFAQGLREARALHSAERRFVADALYAWMRQERGLTAALDTDAPMTGWLGLLVTLGLPVASASRQVAAPYDALADWERRGEGLPTVERLAMRHSAPEDFVTRLVDQLGAASAEAFLVASDQRAPVVLRARRTRGGRDKLAQRLAKAGIQTVPSEHASDGLFVVGRANVLGHEAWRAGDFEVQDEGSQRVLDLLQARGRVIDACAGAGGKSLALADRGAKVLALDVRARALDELRSRAQRAGVQIQTRRLEPDDPWTGLPVAEEILVDAPCTGSGAWRRHPEHRWTWSAALVALSATRQFELLSRAIGVVAPGGRVVYATCSVLREENEDVVERVLAAHPNARIEGAPLRTWPHVDGADGFYAVALTTA